MSTRQLGTFLLQEGALVTALLLARVACLRILPPEGVPAALQRRIERTDRLASAVLIVAALAVPVGVVLRLTA
jgi:hypothetical protein